MNFSLNLPTWFPLAPKVQAGAADAPDETDASPRSAGLGPITGRDLSDLGSLVKPFVRDPFNRLRPPFSRGAAELSLELQRRGVPVGMHIETTTLKEELCRLLSKA